MMGVEAIWGQLRGEGLVVDQPPEAQPSEPWVARLLTGVAAWIATPLLLAFVAMLFGERHGWRLSKSDFSPSVLARRGLFNGRGYHDPWPRELVDHGYFYRKDRKAAAVAAHLYGNFDAAKRQDTEATAALYGLGVTWPEDFPSWYLPGRTTLIVCTPLAEPAR